MKEKRESRYPSTVALCQAKLSLNNYNKSKDERRERQLLRKKRNIERERKRERESERRERDLFFKKISNKMAVSWVQSQKGRMLKNCKGGAQRQRLRNEEVKTETVYNEERNTYCETEWEGINNIMTLNKGFFS